MTSGVKVEFGAVRLKCPLSATKTVLTKLNFACVISLPNLCGQKSNLLSCGQ